MNNNYTKRTYLPGYDVGDYLTRKNSKVAEDIIKIRNVTTTHPSSKYIDKYPVTNKDEIYIEFEVIKEPVLHSPEGPTRFVGIWNQMLWHDNTIPYASLLLGYRPLTEAEKVLYVYEEKN